MLGVARNLNFVLRITLKEFIQAATHLTTDDWQLFLLLKNLSCGQAHSIESHIKKMKSKVYIQNLAKYHDMVTKLIERYA